MLSGPAIIAVYLAWAVFDRALEPALAGTFLELRLATAVVVTALWIALLCGGRRRTVAAPLAFAMLASLQTSIAWMVPRVETSLEAYLLGFSLALYASAFMFVWHWRYTVWLVVWSSLVFGAAVATAPAPFTSRQAVVVAFYGGTAAVVALLGHGLRHRVAWREFAARTALESERTRNHELLTELDRLSQQDALTLLGNRRCWEQRLAEVFAGGSGRPRAAVVLCDVDRFKDINDGHGHAVGDEVLRRVATTMREVARTNDTLARLGGDELALLLPRSGAREAAVVAGRLAAGVRALRLDDLGVPGVTLSIGVAATEAHEPSSPAALVGRADRQLYAAKVTRDAVCVEGVRSDVSRA